MSDFHITGIGKLLGNLISLETVLRLYATVAKLIPGPDNIDYLALAVGEEVPVNTFTSYHQLGALVNLYNEHVAKSQPELVIDTNVIEIRDSLAHGRALTDVMSYPLSLFRFSKPSKVNPGVVTVVEKAVLTEEWFEKSIAVILQQLHKTMKAIELLNIQEAK